MSAGASLLNGRVALDGARHYIQADAHARFLRMQGDTVLFSTGFGANGQGERDEASNGGEGAGDTGARRAQLESLGLSIDWSRSFDSADPSFTRWAQQMFLTLLDAGLAYQGAAEMLWCERCRSLLPAGNGDSGSCRLCNAPVERLPAGQWYLRVDFDSKDDGDPVEGSFVSRSLAKTSPIDLLGRTEGVELDVKAIDGTRLAVFTPHPKQIQEARFVALSPGHPQLSGLVQDPELQRRIEALRSGDFRSDPRGNYPSIKDTGIWLHVPDLSDPLPLVVSLAVDARFGATAVLGIPSADALDEQLAGGLPSAPSMRWGVKSEPLKTRAAVRFRSHSIPISTVGGSPAGIPVPVVRCPSCGPAPVAADALPLREGAEATCSECGEPAPRDPGELDPRVAAWAEALIAIPPEDRAGARPDHPELHRWMAAIRSFHGIDSSRALLCNVVALEELRRRGVVEAAANGGAGPRFLIAGPFEVGEEASAAAADPFELAQRFGADALRFALLHAASPPKRFQLAELDAVLRTSQGFLERLRSFAEPRLDGARQAGEPAIDASDRWRRRLAKWCDTGLRRITENNATLQAHKVTRNAETLLARIEDFEQRVREERGELTAEDESAVRFALHLLVLLLAPVAPLLCEELWAREGNEDSLAGTSWPAPLPA